jgi:hypothetical protein
MPDVSTSEKVQHFPPRDAEKKHALQLVPWKCLPCAWTWQAKAKARANAHAHAHAYAHAHAKNY